MAHEAINICRRVWSKVVDTLAIMAIKCNQMKYARHIHIVSIQIYVEDGLNTRIDKAIGPYTRQRAVQY